MLKENLKSELERIKADFELEKEYSDRILGSLAQIKKSLRSLNGRLNKIQQEVNKNG